MAKSEESVVTFSEKEKLFRERTGKDFESLYKKYYPKLIYFTSRICNDRQKAEDISSDSFIIALDKIDKYEKDKSQFSTWLFTIARNLSLQEIKKDKKTISIDIEYDEEGSTMKDFIIQDDTNDVNLHESIDRKADVVRKQMSELKEPYRTVLEMREIKRMAYKDIATQLGKNLNSVKSQIRNGRIMLISKTKKEFDNIDKSLI